MLRPIGICNLFNLLCDMVAAHRSMWQGRALVETRPHYYSRSRKGVAGEQYGICEILKNVHNVRLLSLISFLLRDTSAVRARNNYILAPQGCYVNYQTVYLWFSWYYPIKSGIYPKIIPRSADKAIMRIGWSFLNSKTVIMMKISSEVMNA